MIRVFLLGFCARGLLPKQEFSNFTSDKGWKTANIGKTVGWRLSVAI